MRRSRHDRLYKIGLIMLFPIIIVGELLWVLDPLRLPNGLYLIDYIDVLLTIAAGVPLCWAIGAISGLVPGQRPRSLTLIVVRIGLIFASVAAVVMLFVNPRAILVLGISLAVAFISVLIDLIASERYAFRSFPRRSVTWAISSLLVLALMLWPTQYLVTYPGIKMNMHRYAQADHGHVDGSIAGVLIFERPAFPIDWVYAMIFPHYEFAPVEDLGMSLGEYNHVVRVMKQDANQVAAAVALERLGIGDGAVYEGVRILSVTADMPNATVISPGDLVIGVEGREIVSSEQLLSVLGNVLPGQAVELQVIRNGNRVSVTAQSTAHPEDPNRAMLGIQIMDQIRYDVPISIDYESYLLHEGGPSHGAMLALAIIDQLTPGGVTNGHAIAGTGTIAGDGTIGRIGGIRQKAYTVARSGADVFFVPAGQEEEARRGAEHLRIVPVRTIDDILSWLDEHPQ